MAGVQVYEEIRKSAADTTAEEPSQAAKSVTVPQYEDIQPVKSAKSCDSYKVTQCAAYGVSLNN